MIETQVNRCVVDGELVELDDLRYTPAGLARVGLKIRHVSTQQEAGIARQVKCDFPAISLDAAALKASKLMLGQLRPEQRQLVTKSTWMNLCCPCRPLAKGQCLPSSHHATAIAHGYRRAAQQWHKAADGGPEHARDAVRGRDQPLRGTRRERTSAPPRPLRCGCRPSHRSRSSRWPAKWRGRIPGGRWTAPR